MNKLTRYGMDSYGPLLSAWTSIRRAMISLSMVGLDCTTPKNTAELLQARLLEEIQDINSEAARSHRPEERQLAMAQTTVLYAMVDYIKTNCRLDEERMEKSS